MKTHTQKFVRGDRVKLARDVKFPLEMSHVGGQEAERTVLIKRDTVGEVHIQMQHMDNPLVSVRFESVSYGDFLIQTSELVKV